MALQGDRLKTARNARGYTTATLAQVVGVEAQQIARWEAYPSDPAASYIVKLAHALDVSTDYLLGESDQFQPIREIDLNPAEVKLIEAYRAGKLIELLKRHLNKPQPIAPPTPLPLPDASDPLVKRQNEYRRKQVKRFRADEGPTFYRYECVKCKATLNGVAAVGNPRCPSCGSVMRVAMEIEAP